MFDKLPALDEPVGDFGRAAEVETTVSEEALHIPISQLDLGPPVTIEADANVRQLIGEMIGCEVSCILVVEKGRLVGIVTERDILSKAVESDEDLAQFDVRSIMTPDPPTLSPDDSVIEAMGIIGAGGCRRASVVDKDGSPVGILCPRTLVDRLVDFFPEDVINLPPHPIRCMTPREGP
ncbi:MAG: CBS domain-containing protein [Planctomycetota bacterium]|jgi:CBS domain-containing protein|nr:CBS domain-containing protein [Planctomycetota bacterium]MDP7130798.1 CBS domain-containing protein [Planctomycetota bacterium]MDP7248840.1 CBS domain-containing protein [Planctomycetota bacterium]